MDHLIKNKARKHTAWDTMDDKFRTRAEGDLEKLQLPQFTTRRDFSHKWHLFKKRKRDRYDVIIGRELQQAIGIRYSKRREKVCMEKNLVDFQPIGHWNKKLIKTFWKDKLEPKEEINKAVEILDAKYEVPDLKKIAEEQLHLLAAEKKTFVRYFNQIYYLIPSTAWQMER